MLFFDSNFYLILGFSGIILYSYQEHYKNSLIYSAGEINYLAGASFGVAAVGFSLGLQLSLQKTGFPESIFNKAFFYSALLEELVKCVFILLFLWYYRIRDVLYDGIYYGVVIGGVFGFVENTIYSSVLSFWPMMLRTITSSSLHMLNGGIAGYFLMKYFFTKEKYKYKFLFEAFAIPYISHAIYNYAGFIGGKYLMLLPFLLVYNFIFVEFISAYAKSSLPKFALDLIQLSIQDYELIRRYTKYELWLYNSQKVYKKKTKLFQRVEGTRIFYISFFLFVGFLFIALYYFFPEIRKTFFKEILIYEYVSIFIIYPFMIAVSVFFGGLVNPEFFQKQILRVPLICVLNLRTANYNETTMVFYLTAYGFYAPFLNPERIQGELDLHFTIGTREFKGIKGFAIWINKNENETSSAKSRFSVSGALIRFKHYPLFLILYWNWERSVLRLRNFLNLM